MTIINCQALGNPRPTISWRKSVGEFDHLAFERLTPICSTGPSYDIFQYVETSGGNTVFHPNGSLVIRAASPEDEGHYRCEVQNGVGEISRTVVLDVQGKGTIDLSIHL